MTRVVSQRHSTQKIFNQLASFVNIIIVMMSEESEVASEINVTASCFRLAFLPFLLYVRVSVFLFFQFGSSPFDPRSFVKKCLKLQVHRHHKRCLPKLLVLCTSSAM